MTSLPQAALEGEDRMSCMEVCGGHGNGRLSLRRPGLDVWISSQTSQPDTTTGGGDLHLISSCASGRITRILMADVCGYGPLFNDLAATLREVMKRNVNSIGPARSVRQMSKQLAAASQRGGFASTLMTTYFAPTRSLAVCNAGHPPPLVYTARAGEWSLVKQESPDASSAQASLGVVAPEEYQHIKTKLESSDLFLSYSNSLAESRDSEGRTLGIAGVLEHVRRLPLDDPGAIPDRLLQRIKTEHADNLRDEDATVILCQATKTPVPWKDKVLAPLRLFRSVSDQTSF